MAEKKKKVGFFTVRPDSEDDRLGLHMLDLLKKDDELTVAGIKKDFDVSDEVLKDYLESCAEKGLVRMTDSGGDRRVCFGECPGPLVGVGINGKECSITVMDLKGRVEKTESIEIPPVWRMKGRNKEVSGIMDVIKKGTGYSGCGPVMAGLSIPEQLIELNPKSVDILSDGISDLFGCDVLITRDSSAAGYGEKDFGDNPAEENILYMHLDVGSGVVMKKELIYVNDESGFSDEGRFLRPWNQFSIVATAKNLVSKGVGTNVVSMVNGDVEDITLDIVLKAAENHDELAEDLIKRAGLALGVRVSYLVNIFSPDVVILGGGIEKKEGDFIHFVRESAERFLLKKMKDSIRILPGSGGKEAYSAGAAALCRRELFMEV